MTVFLVPAAAVALVAAAFLIAGWAINRPDAGRRAKPLSIEDQRTIRWAKALNPKNVHGAGETEAAAKAASGPASADRPAGPVRSNVSRPGSAAEQLPVANEGHTGPGHRNVRGAEGRSPVEITAGPALARECDGGAGSTPALSAARRSRVWCRLERLSGHEKPPAGPGITELPDRGDAKGRDGSRDRDRNALPGGHSRSGSLSPRTEKTPGSVAAAGAHFEACDGCTVMGCGPGCKCACHWGTVTWDDYDEFMEQDSGQPLNADIQPVFLGNADRAVLDGRMLNTLARADDVLAGVL